MADLLQVTTPVAPKSYDYAQKVQQPQGDQIFNLGDTTRINKTTDSAEDLAEQNLKDSEGQALPQIEAAIAKNPAMSSMILRLLIGTEALSMLKAGESVELLNKVTEFANEIMLNPNDVVDDIMKQEQELTIFKGDLWDTLKGILTQSVSMANNNDLKLMHNLGLFKAPLENAGPDADKLQSQGSTEGQMAQNAQQSNNPNAATQRAVIPDKADIQLMKEMITAGLVPKQSAEAQTTNLPMSAAQITDVLNEIAKGTNLSELSDSIIDFMKATVNASSRDDIINSVATNLRFLSNEVAHSFELADSLNEVADNLNPQTFNELKPTIMSLLNYTEQSLILSDHTKNLLPLIVYNMSRFNGSENAVKESFNQIVNMTSANQELSDKLCEQFIKYIENSNLPDDIKLSTLKNNELFSGQRSMTLLADRIGNAVQEQSQNISSEKLMSYVSQIDSSNGTESLKQILTPLVPQNLGGALNTLLRNFDNTKDLNSLIDRLGVIVNSIDDVDKKITVAQKINEVLSNLSLKEGINYKPPTSMENMFDFLLKNINDPALKSLSALDKGEMVQGLVATPSTQTPIMHFLLPVDMDGFRAFGELWVDPNEDTEVKRSKGGGEPGQHMFLCFDIENSGYFELEVYANQDNLNILLLCPEGTEKTFHSLKESMPVIAGACGYNISNAAIGPIKKRRDLTQVFPKINQKRSGLNAKV